MLTRDCKTGFSEIIMNGNLLTRLRLPKSMEVYTNSVNCPKQLKWKLNYVLLFVFVGVDRFDDPNFGTISMFKGEKKLLFNCLIFSDDFDRIFRLWTSTLMHWHSMALETCPIWDVQMGPNNCLDWNCYNVISRKEMTKKHSTFCLMPYKNIINVPLSTQTYQSNCFSRKK